MAFKILIVLALGLSCAEASLRGPHHHGKKGHKGGHSHHHKGDKAGVAATVNHTVPELATTSPTQVRNLCATHLPRHEVSENDEKDAFGWLDGVYDEYEELAYKIPKSDSNKVRAAASKVGKELPIQCNEDSYGEIPQESAAKLFQNPMVNLQAGETFADLGSGLGRLVVDAALVANVKRAIGVELSETRSASACKALTNVTKAFPTQDASGWRAERHRSEVELYQGNILDLGKDFLGKINVAYVANLCFRPDLLNAVAVKLSRDLPDGSRVVSLRNLELNKDTKRLKFKGTVDLPMSWSVEGYAQAVYVYGVN
jgi:SAM-dependent methyltransferase